MQIASYFESATNQVIGVGTKELKTKELMDKRAKDKRAKRHKS